MKVIGMTGGVGAGKSAILQFLAENYKAKTLLADHIAHDLMEPGGVCYAYMRELFAGMNVFLSDGAINRSRMAEVIFQHEELRERLNNIVHPAVKQYVIEQITLERERKQLDYLIVEAALLIEDHYETICDELWYVYTSEETRRQRLIENRGYSLEKIQQIFDSQLSETEYRESCQVVIDNNGSLEETQRQIVRALGEPIQTEEKREKINEGEKQRMDEMRNGEPLVFGLDIGTRNVVGTVGYKKGNEFYVVAQYSKEHDTRSMLDGQIHDIARVGRTIGEVKTKLEEQIGQSLHEVCIAAAGRVLKTITTRVEYEYPEETVVSAEDVHTLDLLGIEKAQELLKEQNDTKFKFYCVGYSVVKYYLNDDIFINLENHKAERISEDVIVTFLPEDVVDGLYTAVSLAGLNVANMTLEPIAAINVAIPEAFRMLNIALVDVGAGTSDISITKDGSIIAYGMIPCAGDEITELIVQQYLVDFKTAEHIKLTSGMADEVEYKDIMGIPHTIPSTEVWELAAPIVEKITTDVATRIKELNGDKSVSATFVVGGGGKIHGFTERLAELLELPYERVALRGEEVLQSVHFAQEEIVKDPLLVTPIGICQSYYDQKNNFIFVRFNGERLKLYDNNKLTIVDAAMAAGFPNEQLFPKRGKEINFTVNGKARIVRGEVGESAVIKVNDRIVNINTPLEPNSEIIIEPSTQGMAAECTLEQLPEYGEDKIEFIVNERLITCPKFAEVNGELEPPFYKIQENDRVEMRSYYTVEQLAEFMDVELDPDREILVNNRVEDMNTQIYENFTVEWTVLASRVPASEVVEAKPIPQELYEKGLATAPEDVDHTVFRLDKATAKDAGAKEEQMPKWQAELMSQTEEKIEYGRVSTAPAQPQPEPERSLYVIVNNRPVEMTGKKEYVFVDVFEFIDFDLQDARGRMIVTTLNGEAAQYAQILKPDDKIEIYWKEKE